MTIKEFVRPVILSFLLDSVYQYIFVSSKVRRSRLKYLPLSMDDVFFLFTILVDKFLIVKEAVWYVCSLIVCRIPCTFQFFYWKLHCRFTLWRILTITVLSIYVKQVSYIGLYRVSNFDYDLFTVTDPSIKHGPFRTWVVKRRRQNGVGVSGCLFFKINTFTTNYPETICPVEPSYTNSEPI